MNRRFFLMLAGAGTALVAVPGMGLMAVSFADAAKKLIQRELKYLKLEEAGVTRFVQDYSKDKTDNYKLKVRSLYLMQADAAKSALVKELVEDYLLATDFFRNRMDENKPVQYLALYDPYKTPCANPFSAAYYPQKLS